MQGSHEWIETVLVGSMLHYRGKAAARVVVFRHRGGCQACTGRDEHGPSSVALLPEESVSGERSAIVARYTPETVRE